MKRLFSIIESAPVWVKVNLRLAGACVLLGVVMFAGGLNELFKTDSSGSMRAQMLVEAFEPLGFGVCWCAIVIGVWRGSAKRQRERACVVCVLRRYGLRSSAGRCPQCGSPLVCR